jgi:membrane protease YdiL (CAAX protease family)
MRRFAGRHGRFVAVMGAVLAVLAGVNVVNTFGPIGSGLILGPVVATALVVLARRCGLTWHDLGLSRRTLVRGSIFAGAAIGVVIAVYAVAALVPLTRAAFLDARYHMATGPALLTALIVIPLGTVLVEEIAFRGVVFGLVTRHRGMRWGLGVSSALFGAWHILPSLQLGQANAAVGGLAGSGAGAQVSVVLAAVAFTAVAGLLLGELRRRSGSLLAAAGLHWAVNGIGVLVATVLYATI